MSKMSTVKGTHTVTVDMWDYANQRLNEEAILKLLDIVGPLLLLIDLMPLSMGVVECRWMHLTYESAREAALAVDLFSTRHRLTEYALDYSKKNPERSWRDKPIDDAPIGRVDPNDIPF